MTKLTGYFKIGYRTRSYEDSIGSITVIDPADPANPASRPLQPTVMIQVRLALMLT